MLQRSAIEIIGAMNLCMKLSLDLPGLTYMLLLIAASNEVVTGITFSSNRSNLLKVNLINLD